MDFPQTPRRVLFVAHTLLSLRYLARIHDLLKSDDRLQFFVTQAPDHFSHGVADALNSFPPTHVPYRQALDDSWDIAFFATHGGAELFRAVNKVHVQHGLAGGKTVLGDDYTYGRSWATIDGQPIYDVMLESSEEVRSDAIANCPELRDRIIVVGDLACDNVLQANQQRQLYRRTLGLDDSDTAILLTSTWGPDGLLEAHGRELLSQLQGLPPNYKVLITAHPHLWADGAIPSDWAEVLSSLPLDRFRVCSPQEDFAPYLAAADVAVIDHSSQGLFFALLQRPTIAAPVRSGLINTGSLIEDLRASSPTWDGKSPLLDIVGTAIAHFQPATFTRRGTITAHPNQAAERIATVIYEQLKLDFNLDRHIDSPSPSSPGSEAWDGAGQRGDASVELTHLYGRLFASAPRRTLRRQELQKVLSRVGNQRALVGRIEAIELYLGEKWLESRADANPVDRLDRTLQARVAELLSDPDSGGLSRQQIRALGARAAWHEVEREMRSEGDVAGRSPDLATVRLFRRAFVDNLVHSAFDLSTTRSAGKSNHGSDLER